MELSFFIMHTIPVGKDSLRNILMNPLTKLQITKFQNLIWTHYHTHGRTMLWRGEKSPYKVLVSEIMLQQTQVSRVTEKYKEFLKRFPTIQSLAHAKLSEVIIVWQGLGYNRRARFLHEFAKKVVLPRTTPRLPKTFFADRIVAMFWYARATNALLAPTKGLVSPSRFSQVAFCAKRHPSGHRFWAEC